MTEQFSSVIVKEMDGVMEEGKAPNSKTTGFGFSPWLIVILSLLFGFALLFSVFQGLHVFGSGRHTACTLEAKQCPGGSYVSRTGPNCEFAACPAISASPALPSNCTSDGQCPSGYACEATEGMGVVYPNRTPAPSPTIIKGVCKVQKNGICKTDSDCISSLVCHAVTQNGTTVQRCEEPVLGTCDVSSGSVCPSGYQCIPGCGPPVVRIGAPTPASFCTANEIAGKPRNCPICLASNSLISTPNGEVNIKNIEVGMSVWSTDRNGNRIPAKVVKVSSVSVPAGTQIVHLVLLDGRQVWVSPNHPDILDQPVLRLRVGDRYDGSIIQKAENIPYWDSKTYDILPDSSTGFYWANDILLGSTLR